MYKSFVELSSRGIFYISMCLCWVILSYICTRERPIHGYSNRHKFSWINVTILQNNQYSIWWNNVCHWSLWSLCKHWTSCNTLGYIYTPSRYVVDIYFWYNVHIRTIQNDRYKTTWDTVAFVTSTIELNELNHSPKLCQLFCIQISFYSHLYI